MKIWGKHTATLSRIKNEEIPLKEDKTTIDKLLIGMGIPIDLLGWFEDDLRESETCLVDEDSKVTLQDMLRMKDLALYNQDFEALKQLSRDVKEVYELGLEILRLQRLLDQCIAKEDFNEAIDIKRKLQQLRTKRDAFDALYETSRFSQMVVYNRPSTAEYQRYLDEMDREAYEQMMLKRRQIELEEEKRRLEEEARRALLEQ